MLRTCDFRSLPLSRPTILQSQPTSFRCLHGDLPFSLYFYEISDNEENRAFDLSTNVVGQSVAIRIGRLGVIFVSDGGLQMHVGPKGPEWAYRIDSLHQDNVRDGLVSADAPNPALIFWDKGWRVIRYRGAHFDSPRANGKNPALAHHLIELTDQTPSLAASSLFSVEHDKAGDIVGPMLTVVPVDEKKTVAIVSYPRKQRAVVEQHLSALFKAGDATTTKRELSKLVIEKVENFALAPIFYQPWTEDKKKRVIDASEGTAKLQNGEDFMLL